MVWPDWLPVDYAKLEPNLTNVTQIQSYRSREHHKLPRESRTTRPLLGLLHLSRRLQATDARDHIFAMRNLASDLKAPNDDWAPQPNYKIPWQHLYTDMAVALLGNDPRRFLILSGTLRHGEANALPSWVPDFRKSPRVQYIIHSRWAAGGKQRFAPKITKVSKKEQQRLRRALATLHTPERPLAYTITITTIMQDALVFLGGCVPPHPQSAYGSYRRSVSPSIQALKKANVEYLATLEHSCYLTSEPHLQAYQATLIADTTDTDAPADTSYITTGYEQWLEYLDDPVPHKTTSYIEAIDNMDTFILKQFCITKTGYFSLVPSITLATDLIAIVAGYDMPVILRPIDNDRHILIGDCYVHGMMESHVSVLIEEFSVKVNKDGQAAWKPEGDVRRNGLSLPVGEYKRILGTLGARSVVLV